FIGMSINNDVLAMATAAGTYGALVTLTRRGADARSVALLAMMTALCLASKRTTLFLLPTALIAVPIARRGIPIPRWARYAVWLGGIVAIGLVCVALLWRGEAADAWRMVRSDGIIRPAPRSRLSHSGRYALRMVDPSDDYRVEISQPVLDIPSAVWAGRTVRLRAWLRADGAPTLACVRVADDRSESVRCVRIGERWQAVEVQHDVSPEAHRLRGAVGIGYPNAPAGRGALLIDDVSLQPADDPNAEWLRNSGAERGRRVLQPAIDALKRLLKPSIGWSSKLLDPATYNRASIRRYLWYTALLFPGFWGNFGWLQVPMTLPCYIALAIICGIALVGLARFAYRVHCGTWRPPLAEAQRRALAIMAVSLGLALAQTLLPMLGRDWQPQGRYLFPALFPIATGLLLGLGAWVPASRRRWVLYGWIAGLLLLDMIALVKTIWPAYNSLT
ncbi:MAG: hypothetical protein J7M34_08850, partial [Anaerolineae bacterium]|nr:hypothetical protein [Anaerolineae bacterium]